jgi:branched-chain amino acid transport system permease protein
MYLRRQLDRWLDQLVISRASSHLGSWLDRPLKRARLAWRRSKSVLAAALVRARIGERHAVAAAGAQLGIWLGWAAAQLNDAGKWSLRQGAKTIDSAERALRSVAAHRSAGLTASARDTWQRLSATGVFRRVKASHARGLAWVRKGLLAPLTGAAKKFAARSQCKEIARDGIYRVEVATPISRHLGYAGIVLIVLLCALPAFAGRDLLSDLIFVLTMLALAQYWNLLAGYAGLVSVGQQAFVGLGGYLLFALTIHVGLDPLVAIPLAGILAGAIALPTALVVFRLRGAYFAIGTWVMAEVYRLVVAQFKQLGGGTGTSLPPFVTNEVAGIQWVKALLHVRTPAARDIITYWAALVLAVGTILLVYLILRSRNGLALAAIRDSEVAAESVGVDNFKTKLWVYVVTAAATGMVGALIYLQKARISPDAAFSVLDWTANVIFIVVIGGIGTIEGPIVGVLVFYVLQINLAHLGTWYLILLGLFAIVVMLFAPKGIWGYLSERFDLVVFPVRRRLILYRNASEAASRASHR